MVLYSDVLKLTATVIIHFQNIFSDSMESTMESSMPSVSSMTSSIPSPPEMKPDITNLSSPTSTQGGATGFSPSSTQPGPPHGFFPHSMQTTASQMSHMGGGHMSSQMSPTGPTYPGKNGYQTFLPQYTSQFI